MLSGYSFQVFVLRSNLDSRNFLWFNSCTTFLRPRQGLPLLFRFSISDKMPSSSTVGSLLSLSTAKNIVVPTYNTPYSKLSVRTPSELIFLVSTLYNPPVNLELLVATRSVNFVSAPAHAPASLIKRNRTKQ